MIEIKIDNTAVLQALERLSKLAENPRPALLAIGEELVKSTKQRFANSTAPDGKTWQANSPVTLKRKKGTKPLIGETGSLASQIHYAVTGDTLVVGSTMEYAAVQQFGAAQGRFGQNKRKAPIPWGNIPARPFLGISTEDEAMISDVIGDYLKTLI